MVDDVGKLHVLCDALTHTGLAGICHNTRLSYLNPDLPHGVRRNAMCVGFLLAAHRRCEDEYEDEGAFRQLPKESRVTAQIMRYWVQQAQGHRGQASQHLVWANARVHRCRLSMPSPEPLHPP